MPETRTKRRVKPQLARAWFDTVLNPLIRALRMEFDLLDQGNFTWRAYPPQFASLVPVRSHLIAEAWDNLDQFLSVYPDSEQAIRRHDNALQVLHERVHRCHSALAANPVLIGRVADALRDSAPAPGSDKSPAELAEFIAEYVINGVESLADYCALNWLWNSQRSEFSRLLDLEEIRPLWGAVRSARAEFEDAVKHLLNALSSIRSRLSFDLDVPIVQSLAG